MKKLLITLTLLLTTFGLLSQSECVTISDGTYGNSQTSPYSPIYGLYDYGRSASIYYASDIGSAKNISSIAWYVDEFQNGYSQSGPYTFSNVKIYFAYTTLSGWSNINNVSGVDMLNGVNVSQGITSWTKVFDGSITFNTSNSWKYITLDTPFSYNGTSNLIIQVENWDGSYSSGYPVFHYTSTSASSLRTMKYLYRDGSMPPTSTDATRSYSRPDIQFCEPSTLPIELLYFDGVPHITYNKLHWVTASEDNNDYFNIYRSADGVYFNNIFTIKGAGNSNHNLYYEVIDRNFDPVINYYILRQTDFDGRWKDSEIISIDNRGESAPLLLKVTNLLGQEVNDDATGVLLYHYSDGTILKRIH